MAIVEIPTDSENSTYTQVLQLEGVFYLFDFHWNTRDEAWYCSIFLTDGTPLVSGIKLVVDYELLASYKVANQPPGALFLIDTTLNGLPCGRNELGVRCKLLYLTSDEL